jgi:hypothetical protein
VARKRRDHAKDILEPIITGKQLHAFVREVAQVADVRMSAEEREGKEHQEMLQLLPNCDLSTPYDPYFGHTKDKIRGDPLVGNSQNVCLSMVPFVFEAMRETLIEKIKLAENYFQRLHAGEVDDDLALEISILANRENDIFNLRKPEERNAAMQFLGTVASRDYKITGNSMNTTLLHRYAALYVTKRETLDALELFHRGTEFLNDELEIDMKNFNVPALKNGSGSTKYCNLGHYSFLGEFGPGPNTARNLISSAPYRVELRKLTGGLYTGDEDGKQVFGMSFYLKHPNTMVIGQIQDIRGERVPDCTNNGLVALCMAERIGKEMGFDRVEAYSFHTNPARTLYPNDEIVAGLLRVNFDQAAKQLGWEKHNGGPDGQINFFSRDLAAVYK